jgi:hypothetical protein
MRDFHHVDGRAPRIQGASLRLFLSVSEKQRPAPVTLEQKDHARIVRGQPDRARARP